MISWNAGIISERFGTSFHYPSLVSTLWVIATHLGDDVNVICSKIRSFTLYLSNMNRSSTYRGGFVIYDIQASVIRLGRGCQKAYNSIQRGEGYK